MTGYVNLLKIAAVDGDSNSFMKLTNKILHDGNINVPKDIISNEILKSAALSNDLSFYENICITLFDNYNATDMFIAIIRVKNFTLANKFVSRKYKLDSYIVSECIDDNIPIDSINIWKKLLTECESPFTLECHTGTQFRRRSLLCS